MEHGNPHFWMEISREHLAHNLLVLRQLASPQGDIMGVVKSQVYGHGVATAALLSSLGLRKFGVASFRGSPRSQKSPVLKAIFTSSEDFSLGRLRPSLPRDLSPLSRRKRSSRAWSRLQNDRGGLLAFTLR